MRKGYMLSFIIVILFSLVRQVTGQDLILFTNGEEIKTKVIEVSEEIVRYRKFDNLSGPIYSKSVKSISRIRFENGSEEILNGKAVNLEDLKSISSTAGLLEKGNRVFVQIPNDASRAGERYFLIALKDWNYWEIVDDVNEAHFFLEFNIDKKPMGDKVAWVVFKDRNGAEFLRSKSYRATTNAFSGYNAFKAVARKLVKNYLVEETFRQSSLRP